ncbi:hypothetical protein B296_00040289 [Ensete ventricosum]|uniref:Uncharacterized protein n=1 Tax=Ensete ventricosum TaxID=4639 RepID=A0A426X874_ENSVE|nr:hypothetical protein B296_00040289 [Ensete ventricosum]
MSLCRFPFIACEIFTCDVDIILRALVEDVQVNFLDLLFSFLKPDHPHSTLLAGYFSKVLIRLIGADENMQFSYMDTMQCVEDTDVLEMIVDKFSSSVSALTEGERSGSDSNGGCDDGEQQRTTAKRNNSSDGVGDVIQATEAGSRALGRE